MTVLLGVFVLFFVLMFLYEHRRYLNQAAEIAEINEQLTIIMNQDNCRMLMVPSGNPAVRDIAASINDLLESNYRAGATYQRTQKNIQKALTNISHDLKTPLTVILGYLEMLQIKMSGNAESGHLVRIVDKIHIKTQEITMMISQFFDITRLESGDMVIEMKKQYLSAICQEVIFDYHDLLKEQGYETNIHIPPPPIYVIADENGLKRILKNLIDNAIKHGNTRKYLGIYLEEQDNMALVKVEDHGEGLTKAESEFIYDRNYSGNTQGGSTGLGLSIAKKLAVRMNGDLEVTSKIGVQTIFTLRIPKC